AVGHAHADDVVFAQRFGRQERGKGGIHAAGEPDEALLETAAADHFILEKADQPLARELGVDGEGVFVPLLAGYDVDVGRASCVGVPFVTGSNFTFSFCFSPLRLRVSTGRALCKSASSGESERAVVSESRSISAVSNASSNSGPRAMTRPVGSITADAPGKPLPPSNPTRFARATNTPCSSAIPRTMRSQRTTEAGSVSPTPSQSSASPSPRAGDALGTMTSCAPSRAATVAARECQASSQIRIAAFPPQLVSNDRTPSCPRSTKRSSSKTP